MTNEHDVEPLLALSNEELYARLADEMTVAGMPGNLVDKARVGRALFSAWLKSSRDSVCSSLHEIEDKGITDASQRLAELYDALTALAGGYPVATLAVIITRLGVDAICPR